MAKQKENLIIKELEYDSDGLNIIHGGDIKDIELVPTGSLGLDIMTGGGITHGYVNLIGPDGVGKSLLSLVMAGNFQKYYNYSKVRIYYWAVEGRFNKKLMNMAPLLKTESETEKVEGEPAVIFKLAFPESAETMYNFILKTIKQNDYHFMHIIDSVDGLKSIVDMDKPMEEGEKVAVIAKLNSQFGRDASRYLNFNKHICLFTHQMRDEIPTGYTRTDGRGKGTFGGNAQRFYSNLRIRFGKLYNSELIYEDPNDNKSRVVGHNMVGKLEKVSTAGTAHSSVSMPLIYDYGISLEHEIAKLAEVWGFVGKKGAWYTLEGENIAQGFPKFVQYLKDNPEVAKKLEAGIRKMGVIKADADAEAEKKEE